MAIVRAGAATRMVLAWIARSCVPAAAAFSAEKLATEAVPDRIEIRNDPDSARMRQMEDAPASEDILPQNVMFDLTIPGAKPAIIINIGIQNEPDSSYPLAARAMACSARQLGAQGPTFASLKKVYSIWIVRHPATKDENTVVRYEFRKTVGGGEPEPAGDADLMEAVFLNLGPPQPPKDPENPSVLRLLDILFARRLDPEEKRDILETEFGIPMTKEAKRDMEASPE